MISLLAASQWLDGADESRVRVVRVPFGVCFCKLATVWECGWMSLFNSVISLLCLSRRHVGQWNGCELDGEETAAKAGLDKPAQRRWIQLLQVPSQKTASWPSWLAVASTITSRQIGQLVWATESTSFVTTAFRLTAAVCLLPGGDFLGPALEVENLWALFASCYPIISRRRISQWVFSLMELHFRFTSETPNL